MDFCVICVRLGKHAPPWLRSAASAGPTAGEDPAPALPGSSVSDSSDAASASDATDDSDTVHQYQPAAVRRREEYRRQYAHQAVHSIDVDMLRHRVIASRETNGRVVRRRLFGNTVQEPEQTPASETAGYVVRRRLCGKQTVRDV